MKPLFAKELRLLQPAFLTALVLAVVPVWLLPGRPYSFPERVTLVPLIFGLVMLALSAFGREFGMHTFALLLAQPLERRRIWRMKSGLLAAACATVFLAWLASCQARLRGGGEPIDSYAVVFGAAAAMVAYAGGLWTTLLLRQVAAAFWFTILAPGAAALFMSEEKTWQVLLVLGLYAVAGFWWARRQFLNAQETAWTGGIIEFSSRRGARAGVDVRRYRPLAALWWKEFQLHQVTLMGMAWLLLMHLGVVGLRRLDPQNFNDTVRTILEVFGGVWIVVPLLASCLSVAEERKLGTMSEQLSLPVSRRTQFGIKLLFTLLVGGLLSALLVCTVEGFSAAISATGGLFARDVTPLAMAAMVLAFVGFAFLGFYASTLAGNVVQALAAAVISSVVIWVLGAIAPAPGEILRLPLWRGYLIYYIAWPSLLATLFWLAWRNFRSETSADHLWRRNALVLGSVLAAVVLVTFAVYQRAWQFLTPVDPRPGAARIVGQKPVLFASYSGTSLTGILPDGRLWVDRVGYNPGLTVLSFGQDSGFRTGSKWTSLSGNQILPGSNWVSAVANFRETVALRSDGTLWISEKPRLPRERDIELPAFEEAAALAQFGSDTNWLDVVREHYYWSVVLLKRDGTLWRLGTNSFAEKNVWPGLRSFTPQRLVSDSGWNRILAGAGRVYAWKPDGSAWMVHGPERGGQHKENEMGVVLEPVPFLDKTKWRGMARFMEQQVALRDDGTLWTWQLETRPGRLGKSPATPMRRIGPDSDWTALAGDWQFLVARKADGSIWQWAFPGWDHLPFREPPRRLGSRNDWVAVGALWGGPASLASDGSLYFWAARDSFSYFQGSIDQPMLGPSRKPVLIENIFAGLTRPSGGS